MALRSRCWELLSVCRNSGCGAAAFSTSSKPEVKPAVDPPENEAVAPEFTNRNPRNLELLALARKERGWGTVWPSREFWHRLRVTRTQHHIEAVVEHRNGQVVVSASTREWAIKKHLYSTKDVMACESIGRVLAGRCLEAGISFMVHQPTPWEAASDSVFLFPCTLKGFALILDIGYLHHNNSSIYQGLFMCQTEVSILRCIS
uniref:Large ribosomal subunit protein uL18m n=1 Tax=Rousettus aegyptiacus TaxID=9407 RepID=A0A7J8KCM3_ROUAE|nr:mitochondrial ribosomal protein L18 [Rousettus aegyptiacus]